MGIEKTPRNIFTKWRFVALTASSYPLLRKSRLFPPVLAAREYLKSFKRIDFSQFGENEVIDSLIPPKGVYLDIGSGRPVSGSNTFRLYKQGWHGVLADPIRANIVSSRLLRKRDFVFQCVVGTDSTNIFYELFPYEYSTLSQETAESLIKNGSASLIQQYPIRGILASTLFKKLPSKTFSFMNIDAEGFDYRVLTSLNLEENRPNLICIEEWSWSSSEKTEIRLLLEQYGYSFITRAGVSNFYSR